MVRGKNKNEVVYENPVYLNNKSSQQAMKTVPTIGQLWQENTGLWYFDWSEPCITEYIYM